jgi:peptidase M20/M25/M40-like protein/recombinase-like zinc beta ribbon protein
MQEQSTSTAQTRDTAQLSSRLRSRLSEPAMLDLAKRLIAIPSENPPGNHYEDCARLLLGELDRLGFDNVRREGACVLASAGTGERTLYFSGHYDVVPAQSRDQFQPRVEGANLFGRGSSDMKSGLAAMIYAAVSARDEGLLSHGRIGIVLVPDEETAGPRGSRDLNVLEPLIPQEMFDRVQQILKTRAAREREVRSKNEPQYTFNGFLYCAVCESPMYSHTNQKDRHFYCTENGTRARKRNPASACPTPYIRAAVIEPKVEQLLSDRLQDDDFLGRVAAATAIGDQQPSEVAPDQAAIGQHIEALSGKRSRVLEAYFDGAISRNERDDRLNRIDAEIESYRRVAGQIVQPRPRVDARALAGVLAVFAEMPYLQREQKRSLLQGIGIAVFVEGYIIREVAMRNIAGLSCDSGSRWKPSDRVTTALIPELRLPINW